MPAYAMGRDLSVKSAARASASCRRIATRGLPAVGSDVTFAHQFRAILSCLLVRTRPTPCMWKLDERPVVTRQPLTGEFAAD